MSEGYFGQTPDTIHEKATHLMRLLVADHSFVDGNKRTALNTAAAFYAMNGWYFDYDDEIREALKRFGRGESVDIDRIVAQVRCLAVVEEQIEDSEARAALKAIRRRMR